MNKYRLDSVIGLYNLAKLEVGNKKPGGGAEVRSSLKKNNH